MNAQAHETLWLTPWTPAPAYEGEDGPIGTDMVKWQGWENAEPTTLRVDAGLDGDDTCRSELITMWAAAQQRARRTGTPGERLVRDQDGAQHIPAITDVNLQVKHKAGSAWRPLDEVMADIAQGTNVHAMELCLTIDGPGADGEVLRWELGEAYVGGSGDSIAEIAIVIAQDSARDVEAVSEILITGWGWVVEDYDSTSPEVQQYWNRCDAITSAGKALGNAQEAKARAIGYAVACWIRPQLDTAGEQIRIEIDDETIEVTLTGADRSEVRVKHTPQEREAGA